MFWNDPNLYSVAFKDTPNFPTPFLGAMPRFFNPYPVPPTYFTPPVAPHMFAPQMFAPQMFAPPVPPTYFTPPVTPFMHTPPTTPFIDPRMTPYSFTHPYFQGYRPFGL
jgi:hypothetical protein